MKHIWAMDGVYNTVSVQMMIDKLRKRFNHSASLGKTLARTQQPHLSYAEPREFDLRSLNDSKSLSKKPSRAEPNSTPKPPSGKAVPSVPANLCMGVGQGLLAIQLNRQRCGQLSSQVHTASMAKSLHVNRMYKELHHFSICVDELRWLLTEGDTLLRAYLAQTSLIAPHSTHTTDVAHIAQEFRSLMLRFQQIDREQLTAVEECLRVTEDGMHGHGFERRALQTFPEVQSIMSIKDHGRESEGTSFLETRHFSLPMKENLNTSNLPHFDNIKITKTETTKPKFTTNTNTSSKAQNQNHPQTTMAQSVKLPNNENIEMGEREKERERQRQREQLHRREKEQLYKKLRQEHERNETLQGSIEMLKEEISTLERKLTTYKVASRKSIDKLADILRRLTATPAPTPSERELEMLKMAQAVSGWEKLIQDELQEAKYRELYGHPEAMQGEKTVKLKEIIELQYEINELMDQRQHLEKEKTNEQEKMTGRASEEVYRMLVMQASALEELCTL